MSPVCQSAGATHLSDYLWRLDGATVFVPQRERYVEIKSGIPAAATKPLLWTGLRNHPAWLSWIDAPIASAYVLRLSTQRQRIEVRQSSAVFRWPSEFITEPGDVVNWSISSAEHPADSVAGVFWLLSASRLRELMAAERVVVKVERTDLRGFAQALTAAEFGLYDDAIGVLDAMLCDGVMKDHVALVHRASIAILTEMKEKAPSGANQQIVDWILLRIRAHFKALQRSLPRLVCNPAMLEPSRAFRRAEPVRNMAA